MHLKELISDINNKKDLKEILYLLKLYKDLINKVWKRWKDIFRKSINNYSKYRVEYSSSLSLDYVKNKSLDIYLDFFKDNIENKQILFIKNDSIWAWIRLYRDQDMLDLTYKKIEENFKK